MYKNSAVDSGLTVSVCGCGGAEGCGGGGCSGNCTTGSWFTTPPTLPWFRGAPSPPATGSGAFWGPCTCTILYGGGRIDKISEINLSSSFSVRRWFLIFLLFVFLLFSIWTCTTLTSKLMSQFCLLPFDFDFVEGDSCSSITLTANIFSASDIAFFLHSFSFQPDPLFPSSHLALNLLRNCSLSISRGISSHFFNASYSLTQGFGF
mgnify:CR=1 FL=1